MRHLTKSIVVLSLVVVFFIEACYVTESRSNPTQSQPPEATANLEQSLYNDPFTYCVAVGTIDAPDVRYDGPEVPDSIIQSLIQQGVVSADAPSDYLAGTTVWRCMDDQVWACVIGANLPCQEKADTSQAPTAAMEDYCKTNLTADYIPAAVTGRATVYEWKCNAGKPEAGQQVFQVDPQGYLANFWYKVAPEQ
jgi:hypothetical protein